MGAGTRPLASAIRRHQGVGSDVAPCACARTPSLIRLSLPQSRTAGRGSPGGCDVSGPISARHSRGAVATHIHHGEETSGVSGPLGEQTTLQRGARPPVPFSVVTVRPLPIHGVGAGSARRRRGRAAHAAAREQGAAPRHTPPLPRHRHRRAPGGPHRARRCRARRTPSPLLSSSRLFSGPSVHCRQRRSIVDPIHPWPGEGAGGLPALQRRPGLRAHLRRHRRDGGLRHGGSHPALRRGLRTLHRRQRRLPRQTRHGEDAAHLPRLRWRRGLRQGTGPNSFLPVHFHCSNTSYRYNNRCLILILFFASVPVLCSCMMPNPVILFGLFPCSCITQKRTVKKVKRKD
jgi:hypothetical protein|uniref:Uncharacterized protein n=1 Tax=Zea mays TaxID=4577 RepID=A0A804M0F6_MAIZE